MRRNIFTEDHDNFRSMIRRFLEREVVPVFPKWMEQELIPRDFFNSLAELGVLGLSVPEEYGGSGTSDPRYNVILSEEVARALVHLGPLRAHMDVVLPYFLSYASDEQRKRWFPGLAKGELMTAIAMTEPGTGSDLAGISTTAVRDGDGDDAAYIVNGAKTFITGGLTAELFIVVARTSVDAADRRRGLSLLVVENCTPGFTRGRKLEKLGLPLQDTVELSFTDVHVPARNLLGEEGQAFSYLGQNLAGERLSIASASVAAARAALEITSEYVRERRAFGKLISSFQNTRFELAAIATEVEAAQAMVDQAVLAHADGELSPVDAAKAKLFCTEVQSRAVDRCLQLFGGYGYMMEYPIARLYADARVSRIYGGTSEVLKTIISKALGI